MLPPCRLGGGNKVIIIAVSLFHLLVCRASAVLYTASFRSALFIRQSDIGYRVSSSVCFRRKGCRHHSHIWNGPPWTERPGLFQRTAEESTSEDVISETGSRLRRAACVSCVLTIVDDATGAELSFKEKFSIRPMSMFCLLSLSLSCFPWRPYLPSWKTFIVLIKTVSTEGPSYTSAKTTHNDLRAQFSTAWNEQAENLRLR